MSTERISIARTMVASARVVSSLAKCSPMHGRRSTEERKELPAVAGLGVLRAEPVGVEVQRVGPKGRIPVQAHSSHGHQAARLHPVAVDGDVARRQPSDARGWRAQPQRLVQHLHGVSEPGHVVGRQLAIPIGRPLRRRGPACQDGAPAPTASR